VNILKGELTDKQWNEGLDEAIRAIFKLVVELGGTLSGEHGIGLVQKEYMPLAFSDLELQRMWEIKRVFDPNLIMNPGKVFPEHYWKLT
jgi:glycolate oxidase